MSAMTYAEAVARITGPGSPFELVEEDVRGIRMPVFKNRARNLRDVLVDSLQHGDAELAVWDSGELSLIHI